MEDWIAGEVNKNKQRIFGGIREDTGNDERNIRSTNETLIDLPLKITKNL